MEEERRDRSERRGLGIVEKGIYKESHRLSQARVWRALYSDAQNSFFKVEDEGLFPAFNVALVLVESCRLTAPNLGRMAFGFGERSRQELAIR